MPLRIRERIGLKRKFLSLEITISQRIARSPWQLDSSPARLVRVPATLSLLPVPYDANSRCPWPRQTAMPRAQCSAHMQVGTLGSALLTERESGRANGKLFTGASAQPKHGRGWSRRNLQWGVFPMLLVRHTPATRWTLCPCNINMVRAPHAFSAQHSLARS